MEDGEEEGDRVLTFSGTNSNNNIIAWGEDGRNNQLSAKEKAAKARNLRHERRNRSTSVLPLRIEVVSTTTRVSTRGSSSG